MNKVHSSTNGKLSKFKKKFDSLLKEMMNKIRKMMKAK